jgi:hypothetical protein
MPHHKTGLDSRARTKVGENYTARAKNFSACIRIERNGRGTICMPSETFLPSGRTVHRYTPRRRFWETKATTENANAKKKKKTSKGIQGGICYCSKTMQAIEENMQKEADASRAPLGILPDPLSPCRSLFVV